MDRRDTPLRGAVAAVRPALGVVFLLSVFINLALLASPIYSMQVYDRVLQSRNGGTLLMLTLIVGLFLLVYAVLEYARSGILVRASVRLHDGLSGPLLDAAMRAQLAGAHGTASSAQKDGDTLREGLASGAISALFDVPWTPFFAGLCYLLHPILGIVAAIGALLILGCALLTELATRHALADATRHSQEMSRLSMSTLRGAETVRGLGMAGAVRDRLGALQNDMIGAQAKASERAAAVTSFSKLVRFGVQVALMGTGAWLAIDGLISPGVMMAATIMMGRALAPVEQVVANWRRFSTMRAAHGRLAKLFAEFPERTAATELPAPLGHLSIEGLVIVPPNAELPSVKGATFSATPGECLAIMGASGSGKSSIARAVANVWPAAKGDVRLDGAALPQWDADLLGRHIGYVPQEVELFAGTISENIARMGVPADEAVIAAAKAAGLHEAIVRLKKGYDTVLGPGGTGLSGGMRQRVALARALYGNPKLVVLDEPNASLDADGEAALNDTIRRLKSEKVTIVVVTHRPQLVMQADKVLIMNAGQVQAFGPREAVLQKIAAVRQSGPRAAATTAAA